MKKNGVNAIPAGYHVATPALCVRGAAEAIEFYKKAFGAIEKGRHAMPDGKTILHAHLRIGESALMLVDEMPDFKCFSPQTLKGTPVTIHIYVENVDAFVSQAVAAGAKVTMPVMDAFWGDRYGKIEDPYGHEWSVATHMRDLTPAEMEAAAKEAFSKPMPK
jgi:PhnB protein